MLCEKGSCTIIIASSDSDNVYEEPQSVEVRSIAIDCDETADDEDDDCLTPPRPKKSKGRPMHAGAAIYKCKYNTIWTREFPFIAPVSGDPCR